MRPVNDRSVDFRERVPTGSARRRLLIPPVLDQKARISTAQGCQHRVVILAKKRSRSSKWRMFTTLTDHRIKLMSSGHCSPCIHEAPSMRLPAPTPQRRAEQSGRGTRVE
jgi:hypothetical protein